MIYTAEIKEVGKDHILKPSLQCYDARTKEQLVEFWGLKEPDVEWYRLHEVIDGKKVEL